MHKNLIIWLLLFVSVYCFGKDCNGVSLQKAYTDIKEHVAAFRATEAVIQADTVLAKMNKSKDIECQIYFWILYQKGEGLELLLNYEDALTLYHDYIPKASSLGYWDIVAETYVSIARIHEIIGRPIDCKRNLNKAKEIIETYVKYGTYSTYAVRRSSYHRIYESRDSARFYALEAIKYGKKYNVPRSEIDGNLIMGITSENPDTIIYYLKNTVALYLERKAYFGASSQMSNIVNAYIKKGKYQAAFVHLDTMNQLINNIKVKDKGYYYQVYRYYELKKEIYLKLKNIDSAYVALEISQANRIKSENIAQQDKINEIEIRQAVYREIENTEALAKKTKTMLMVIFIGGFLMMSLIVFMVTLYKKQKEIAKQNSIIDIKNEELKQANDKQNTLLSEVHHRVKNNLQLVISMITILSIKVKNEEQKNLLKDVSNKVYSIALIHDQLYKNSDFEKINIYGYIKEMVFNYQELQTENSEFSTDITPEDIALNIETVLPIGIILTELISNSLKYAKIEDQILRIKIQLKVSNNKYIMTYKDNGPGYNDSKVDPKKTAMGFSIIHNMIRQLQAESTQYNDDGVVFTIIFEEKRVSKI